MIAPETIYHVEREEEDGIESFHVFRFIPSGAMLSREKKVLDTFPSREEADGVAEHMNHQWSAYFRAALQGTSQSGIYSPEEIARRAYYTALAAVEVFT